MNWGKKECGIENNIPSLVITFTVDFQIRFKRIVFWAAIRRIGLLWMVTGKWRNNIFSHWTTIKTVAGLSFHQIQKAANISIKFEVDIDGLRFHWSNPHDFACKFVAIIILDAAMQKKALANSPNGQSNERPCPCPPDRNSAEGVESSSSSTSVECIPT